MGRGDEPRIKAIDGESSEIWPSQKNEGILKLSCSAESLYLLIGKADPCETLTVWLMNRIEYTDRGARNFSLCNSAKNAVGVARIRTQLSGKERKHNSNC